MSKRPTMQEMEIESSLSPGVRQRAHYRMGRRPPPPKTTLAAVFMLLAGSIMLTIGLTLFWHDKKDRGIGLLVLGSILLIPGSYASVVLYGAYMGWRGYDYAQVPSYDD